MRRLSEDAMLHRAIAAGTAFRSRLVPVADLLARFFASAPAIDIVPADYLSRFTLELERNRAVLHDGAYGVPEELPRRILDRLARFLDEEGALLLARLSAGCIIEGHGDLRPEHVHLGEPPCVIDCLEFDRTLRLLDPVEELGFLALECGLLGGEETGAFLLARCAAVRPPAPPDRLVAFYTAFRACLRARLSLAHLNEPSPRAPETWRPRALRYLAEADRACARLDGLPGAT
jgi:aminoglycoside phosphotransferase family enzyme